MSDDMPTSNPKPSSILLNVVLVLLIISVVIVSVVGGCMLLRSGLH